MESVTVSSFVILTVRVELGLTPATKGLSINPVVNESIAASPHIIPYYGFYIIVLFLSYFGYLQFI